MTFYSIEILFAINSTNGLFIPIHFDLFVIVIIIINKLDNETKNI